MQKISSEKELLEIAKSSESLNIQLTNDYAFRKIFRNKIVLRGFLIAVLGLSEEEVEDIEIEDPHQQGENNEEKEGVLDIKIFLNHNRKINIEMQLELQDDWIERSIFYICRMYSEGFKRGMNYQELEPCIHIGILDFNILKGDGFSHSIALYDQDTKELYSDKLGFRVIELKKLMDTNEEEKLSELYRWAKLIAAKTWKEAVDMANGNKYMEEVVKEMDKIDQDEHERYLYLRRDMAYTDALSIKRTRERIAREQEEKAKKQEEKDKKQEERDKKQEERDKKQEERDKKQEERDKKQEERDKELEEREKQLEQQQEYIWQQRNEFNQMKIEFEKMNKELQDKINKLS